MSSGGKANTYLVNYSATDNVNKFDSTDILTKMFLDY